MEQEKRDWKRKTLEFTRPTKLKLAIFLFILFIIFLENFGPLFNIFWLSEPQNIGGPKDIIAVNVPKYHIDYIFKFIANIVTYYNIKTRESPVNYFIYFFFPMAIILSFFLYYLISCLLDSLIRKVINIKKKGALLLVFFLLILLSNGYAISDTNSSNNAMTRSVSIINVKNDVKVLFVKIDDPANFNIYIFNSSDFLNKILPIGDNKVNPIISPKKINSSEFFIKNGFTAYASQQSVGFNARQKLLKELDSYTGTDNVDYVIGIVPSRWFDKFPGAYGVFGESHFYAKSALVTVDHIDTVSHEIGHTIPINLCDESSDWNSQNQMLSFGFGEGCPNANDGGTIKSGCLGIGCMTETLGIIAGNNNPDFVTMFSFMGGFYYPDVWSTGEIYNRTIIKLNASYNKFWEWILVSMGTIFKNGSVELGNSYVVEGFETTPDELIPGNVSINLKVNNSIYYSINFTPIFTSYLKTNQTNSSIIESNETFFLFTLPYNQSISKIEIKENSTIKVERNVTPNTPIINITYPLGGKVIENKFNVTWNATDADGDKVYYAILISDDGGVNYTTLDMDLNQTYYELDPADYDSGSNHVIKVLATDGINTGTNITGTFTLGNPLKVTALQTIYSNGTSYIFGFMILNNGTMTLTDIRWLFDLGDGTVINSTYNASLVVGEDMLVYVSYNYSDENAHTVKANATAIANGVSAFMTLGVGGSTLLVNGLKSVYSNLSSKVFEFSILNNGTQNVSINWTLNLGDGTVVASNAKANLSVGEQAFEYVAYQYASQGDYSVTATAQAGSSSGSQSIPVEVEYLGVSNFSTISSNGRSRVFEASLVNYLGSNLSNVSWRLNTGNGNISSVIPAVLQPQERALVLVEYNYTSAGSFVANFSAVNKTYVDWELLNVTVT